MTYEEFHSTPFILESERLEIRRLTMDDDEAIHSYGKDERVAHGASFPQHKDIEDARTFLRTVLEHYEKKEPSSYGVILRKENTLIGGIGLPMHDRVNNKAEIGYAFAPWHWNKGYATEATRMLIDHLFTNTDVERVEARCKMLNTASARVMEKSGMTYEGTLRSHTLYNGVYYDMKFYSILRSEWSNRS
jgi:ribosomal-protein-alanine N-acetyltransferase